MYGLPTTNILNLKKFWKIIQTNFASLNVTTRGDGKDNNAEEKVDMIRTRDPSILETCDIVVDVGGVFDHNTKRYDHHQREFSETMNSLLNMDHHIRLSSAGLIYAYYGQKVIASILKIDVKSETTSILFKKLYQCFVESVDAIDNGVQQFDEKPRYQLSSTLNSRVNNLNPVWNDKESSPDTQFTKAMKIVGEEFEDRLHYFYNAWLPARDIVLKCINERKEVHPSGKIIEFKTPGVPWKDHFFTMEKELGLEGEDICLVLYSDDSDSSWRVQAIPVSDTSGFFNRIDLPWKGFRNIELEKESGISGAIFVHVTGFIGGAKTRDGAFSMAVEALRQAEKI